MRQIELALLDLRVHRAANEFENVPFMASGAQVHEEIAVLRRPDWVRTLHSFQHIFSGGYAAGYYGYLWAERLSADGFEPFELSEADRRCLGESFRVEILSKGASRPAFDSFTAFRGREPQSEALLRSLGLPA